MEYSILKGRSMVSAYTDERLNFEPKDWRKDFKKDLSSSIRELVPNGDYLKAKLITTEKDFFDVENILFYNLGTANFKKLDTKGVSFSLERREKLNNKKYVHEYSFVNSFEGIKADIIAEWDNIVISKPTTSRKPLDYWIQFKQSKSVKTYCVNYNGEFGLSIEINKPRKEVLNIANIQKPLLDGLISVFHEVYNIDKEAVNYIVSKTNFSAEDILSFINDNKIAILPQREIIYKYSEGIKWNPQDEKCTDVRIIIKETDDKFFKVSGFMFVRK